MKMPWGKHKGQSLTELASSYLQWLLDNCDWMKEPLREAIDNELKHRDQALDSWHDDGGSRVEDGYYDARGNWYAHGETAQSTLTPFDDEIVI